MAHSIRKFKGIWLAEPTPAAAGESTAEWSVPLLIQEAAPLAEGTSTVRSTLLHPGLLDHRLRLLHLADQRQNLGRELLLHSLERPAELMRLAIWSIAWSYRQWAHARLFALTNYLNVELPPQILQNLRQPWRFARYLQSTFWLWSLLELAARKGLQQAPPTVFFRLTRGCPPLFIWFYERQLLRILGQDMVSKQRGWKERSLPSF